MDAGEGSSGITSLKRQRAPLSVSEDNALTRSEDSDGQKRRRLEPAGQENCSPKASTSTGRRAELETKPDTPMVPSVRSRVRLLTQNQEGSAPLAQRCLSDPGTVSSSAIIQDKSFREHLLGEGEFHQRMELFKEPVSQNSCAPTPSSANPCPRTTSNFVSDIQQKLQGSTTPSSKQAVRMRQERAQELSQLQFHPISQNAWLKKSSSDPSLTQTFPQLCLSVVSYTSLSEHYQERTPPGLSYSPRWVPRFYKGSSWPPVKLWDAADNAEMKDNSFGGATTSSAETQASDGTALEESERAVIDHRQGDAEETQKEEGGKSSEKVSCILEHKLISHSTPSKPNTTPMESRTETSISGFELNSHDDTNTADIIDQMFQEVLEYAETMEEESTNHEVTEDRNNGTEAGSAENIKVNMEEGEKSKEKDEIKEEGVEENGDENKMLDKDEDDMLTFPPSGILSPLSKSVEAVVTPLRIVVSQEANPPALPLTPEETTTPPESSLPYSIDAYRTQRQSKPPTSQSITPEVQRQAPEKSQPQPSVNIKERIKALNEEAGKLQTVISQTLQALSCCTDEEHGQGSLVEAEAEKLLLVSCEKRSALLTEMARLREERNSESEAAEENKDYNSQQPCRGTVSITNIQLPLKVEYVCSSRNRSGRPSHYFFILIRYGPCNIVATPLATAADAKNGDTISFPTSVTLKDIRSTFEIDVEVYSLTNNSGNNCTVDRIGITTKSRVTPRKLLNTITRSNNSLTTAPPPALNTRRSSNFSLVGSHKITLASLGRSKFPLDKVPFLSPLEGNIYMQLASESHSDVQHQGFLTMFEVIGGFGVWNRQYFVLEGFEMYYWNHPNDRETKRAEGSISLSSSHRQCVRPVNRDSCARPFTFELVSNTPHQQQQEDVEQPSAKCWFSADTKQERLDWMESLNQVLLDCHTWNRTSAAQTANRQSDTSSSGNLRESIL
ncbi:anillin isoform X4 [Xyrichtys novacula]|uniref:Anillin isoform X4 n=1 Tax=Xyrichtys novacula TaxID=13765 RepID=A0AAV1F801_XYRNO|nr:anillin isoform X4 [Xyrichtys novacula]